MRELDAEEISMVSGGIDVPSGVSGPPLGLVLLAMALSPTAIVLGVGLAALGAMAAINAVHDSKEDGSGGS